MANDALMTRANRTPRHYCMSNVFQKGMVWPNPYRAKTGLAGVN